MMFQWLFVKIAEPTALLNHGLNKAKNSLKRKSPQLCADFVYGATNDNVSKHFSVQICVDYVRVRVKDKMISQI